MNMRLFHNYKKNANAANVFSIESGESFVDILASHLLDSYKDNELDLARVRILLPTRRACLALREAFLRRTDGRALLLPQMSPVFSPDEEEIHFLSGVDVSRLTPPIHTTRRLLLLMPLIKRAFPEELNTQQALSLATHLTQFIDNLYILNLSLDDLDRLSPEDERLSQNWQKVVVFLKTIIAEFWPDILAQTGHCDVGAYRVNLIKAYTQFWHNHPPQDPVIVAGTMASVPALADMIAQILKFNTGYLVLPGLDSFMDEESWDSAEDSHGQFLLKALLTHLNIKRETVSNLTKLPQHTPRYAPIPPQLADKQAQARRRLASEMMRPAVTLSKWADEFSLAQQSYIHDATENLSLAEVKNSFEEARYVASIIRDALNDAQKTIMVVTPNRKLAALIQKEMLFWGINIDDSAGVPLAATALGRYILSLVALVKDGFAPLGFLSFFKNSYFRGGKDIQNYTQLSLFIKRFETEFCRGTRRYQSLSVLATLIAEEWGGKNDKLLDVWQKIYPFLARLDDFWRNAPQPDAATALRLFTEAVEHYAASTEAAGDALLWCGDAGEVAAKFLSDLLDNLHGNTQFNIAEFYDFLLHLMQSATVRPQFGTHPRIRLLGTAESRLQTADVVVLCGLNEGSWPSDSGHNPWMSRPMLKQYGFPSPERALAQSAHDFTQGFCAPCVYLSRALSVDGALSVPSRWIARLKTILTATKTLGKVHDAALPYIQKALLLPMASQKTPPISQPAPILPKGKILSRLSITEIGALLSDPYALYARRILELRPLDPIDKQPDAMMRGSLMHKALENFSKKFPHTLPPNAEEELLNCGKEVFAPYETWNADIHAFWWPRFEAMAAWFAAHEQSWRQKDNLIFCEKEVHYTFTIGDENVLLKGRADRIEKHQDGWVVIDYKTGSSPSNVEITAGTSPQLTITGALLLKGGFSDLNAHKSNMNADSIKALYYWQISGKNCAAKIVKPDKDTSLTQLCEDAYNGFEKLLFYYNTQDGAFVSFPHGAQKAAPFSGDYSHLSRISEWAVNDEENSENEDAA